MATVAIRTCIKPNLSERRSEITIFEAPSSSLLEGAFLWPGAIVDGKRATAGRPAALVRFLIVVTVATANRLVFVFFGPNPTDHTYTERSRRDQETFGKPTTLVVFPIAVLCPPVMSMTCLWIRELWATLPIGR